MQNVKNIELQHKVERGDGSRLGDITTSLWSVNMDLDGQIIAGVIKVAEREVRR